jgi:S-formylglutathione hydrolase FrmB
MSAPLRTLAEYCFFGGMQRFLEHDAREMGLPMRLSVFLPPQAALGKVPALGLTCNEETFAAKAGAQRLAAEFGVALIAPDTSPRNAVVAGEADNWDFGVGAGFYLDATQAPWSTHWRMESYLGPDTEAWQDHDASSLMQRQRAAPYPEGILIDRRSLTGRSSEELFALSSGTDDHDSCRGDVAVNGTSKLTLILSIATRVRNRLTLLL